MQVAKRILAASLCVFLGWASHYAFQRLMNRQDRAKETGLVESALKSRYAHNLSSGIPLVIDFELDRFDEEFAYGLLRDARGKDQRIVEAVYEFCVKNAEPKTFEVFDAMDLPHVVLRDKDWDAIFKEEREVYENWEAFYKLYPKSPVITLSRPGFSKDGTLALIFMETKSPALYGQVYVFEWKAGKWVETTIRIGPMFVS